MNFYKLCAKNYCFNVPFSHWLLPFFQLLRTCSEPDLTKVNREIVAESLFDQPFSKNEVAISVDLRCYLFLWQELGHTLSCNDVSVC